MQQLVATRPNAFSCSSWGGRRLVIDPNNIYLIDHASVVVSLVNRRPCCELKVSADSKGYLAHHDRLVTIFNEYCATLTVGLYTEL